MWIFDARSDRLIGRVPIGDDGLRAVDDVARRCCAAKRAGLQPALRGSTPAFYALLDLAGLVGALRADVPVPVRPWSGSTAVDQGPQRRA